MSARNTIVLIGDLAEYHDERRAAAGSTLKPGYIAQTTAADEVTNHATAGGEGEGLVVKEDDMQGRTVDTQYAVGDPVMLHRVQKGDLCQLVLKAGQNVAITDWLTSNGDGTVKKAAGTDVKSWKPGEPLDLSGGGAVDTFIKAYKV